MAALYRYSTALLTLSALLALSALSAGLKQLTPENLNALLSRTQNNLTNPSARAAELSRYFVGVPYELGPLGEGESGIFDQDPLIRFDKADCTTMVETVMAMALSSNMQGLLDIQNKIRYKNGQIAYETRNHFPEADWIPNNIKAGFLKDITQEIGGGKTAWIKKTISKKRWYETKTTNDLQGFAHLNKKERQKLVRQWRGLGAAFKDEEAELPYVAVQFLSEMASRIPTGSIFNLVRENQAEKPVLISHQGFIIQQSDGPYVRHMAWNIGGQDVPLTQYLTKYANSPWKLLGMNFLQLQQPPAQ